MFRLIRMMHGGMKFMQNKIPAADCHLGSAEGRSSAGILTFYLARRCGRAERTEVRAPHRCHVWLSLQCFSSLVEKVGRPCSGATGD